MGVDQRNYRFAHGLPPGRIQLQNSTLSQIRACKLTHILWVFCQTFKPLNPLAQSRLLLGSRAIWNRTRQPGIWTWLQPFSVCKCLTRLNPRRLNFSPTVNFFSPRRLFVFPPRPAAVLPTPMRRERWLLKLVTATEIARQLSRFDQIDQSQISDSP